MNHNQSFSFRNFYVPSCRALVCVTFCMNVTAVREFLGLHPFFASKNGWKIKQKSLFLFLSYVHFLSFLRLKERKERKPKEILKFRNENFRPLTKCQIRYGKFSFLHLKISNRIPSGLRPEPPTAYNVSRDVFCYNRRIKCFLI